MSDDDSRTAQGASRLVGESRQQFRPRHKLRLPIELDFGVGPKVQAMTYGISVGGAFIESAHLTTVGTPLHLVIHPSTLPGGQGPPLRLRAVVRWLNVPGEPTRESLPVGFGVAFKDVGPRDEVQLHQLFAHV